MAREVFQHTLNNGLKIIAECNAENASSAIGFFVKTGARDESAKESGISHFLEHMMFKGTKKRSTLDISYGLGNLAANSNAFTSEETTVYYASVLPEYFTEMQELLCDMLRPTLPQEEFDMEKKVILEEIALYEDRPQFYLFEHALQDFFGGHPAGKSVLGTTESVAAITQPEMKDYLDRRYSPSNMVLVATGKLSWDRFLKDAEKYCGSWSNFKTGREVTPFSPKPIQKEYRKKGINQSHLVLLTSAASAQEDERYELALLSTILGDGVGSKLYWDLVDKGIAETAVCELDTRDGTGVLIGYAAMNPKDMDHVLSRMKQILSSPLDFTETDLERAKTKYISRIVLGGELPMGRLMSVGSEWIYRTEIHSLQEEVRRFKGITKKDIESALKKYPLGVWSECKLLPN